MEKLVRKHLLRIQPYKPVVPLEVLAERVGVPVEKLIKLDGNENPYGPPPQVKQALAEYNFYHIYPDPFHQELRQRLSEYTGIPAEHIALGNGSDELIMLLLFLLLDPGDAVINLPPSFIMYDTFTRICGGRVIEVPRNSSYEVDVEAIKSAIDERTKIIFLAWPNNPTGNASPSVEDILKLTECGPLVVVDEAYYEFSGLTVAPHVLRHSNLCVLRTFSKWAGLAGLRVGYGIFPKWLAELIYQTKVPYNVNVAAQVAAKAVLENLPPVRERIRLILEERERLKRLLKQQGILDPFPSQANFLLCRVLNGKAARLRDELARKGIFIRHFDVPGLEDKLRITVGRPEHTEALLQALDEVTQKL